MSLCPEVNCNDLHPVYFLHSSPRQLLQEVVQDIQRLGRPADGKDTSAGAAGVFEQGVV